jgi:SAM-dependent methyltransferase
VLQKRMKREIRSVEQLRQDYELEKELAAKLRNASREDRRLLYPSVYDEYYKRVSQAPHLLRRSTPESKAALLSKHMSFLGRFLNKEATFLEVGAGDCALSIEVAKHVRRVYAVDVSANVSEGVTFPHNCEMAISDGSSIPVGGDSVNVVFSNQLMEHLHPDDAYEQLQNIYKALAPGGHYICITPNRLSGPHDISKYFDKVSTGFHLKEYSISELAGLLKTVGFSSCESFIGTRRRYIKAPIVLQRLLEALMGVLPDGLRRRVARSQIRGLLGIRLVGRK